MRAQRGHALRRAEQPPLESARRFQLQSPQQVYALWYPGQRRRHHSQEPGLWGTEFDNVGLQLSQNSPQAEKRQHVTQRRNSPLHRDRDRLDAFAFSHSVERFTRRAQQDNAKPCLSQRTQSPAQQKTTLRMRNPDHDQGPGLLKCNGRGWLRLRNRHGRAQLNGLLGWLIQHHFQQSTTSVSFKLCGPSLRSDAFVLYRFET